MDILAQINENIRNAMTKIGLTHWLESLGLNTLEVIHTTESFLGGLVVGIVLKKYFKILLWGALITGLVIAFLQYHQAITINWPLVNTTLGLSPATDISALAAIAVTFIKNNVALSAAGAIGLIMGLKIG
jgi:uncharacterized membrane protein (Fun14 family)